MNKNLFVSKLKEIKIVAHRLGYQMTNYPENSISVLETIFKDTELLDSCFGFEFDICFTKDNVPVVIHDKYIDDVSDNCGLVQNYTLEELKNIKFKTRTSLKNKKTILYDIVTLEEILNFFENNLSLLNDKLIKIETKDFVFSNLNNFSLRNLKVLSEIIKRYPNLSKNIVHLSFWPFNLLFLRKIQKKNNDYITKNDLLCDYNIVVFLSRFMTYLDFVSLRIKTKNKVNTDKINSKRVNRKIHSDSFFMKFSNVINEKNLKYQLNKYGVISLYTLNSEEDIDEICKHLKNDFFKENFEKFIITSNNPKYLKSINKVK